MNYRFRKLRVLHDELRSLNVDGFFFFQAEDGIRDVAVTGVQTCALPILFSLRKSTTAYRLGLYDFLVRHGYTVHRVEGNADYLGDRITPENLMRWNVYDVFCIPSS